MKHALPATLTLAIIIATLTLFSRDDARAWQACLALHSSSTCQHILR